LRGLENFVESGPQIWIGRGARNVEDRLIRDLGLLLPEKMDGLMSGPPVRVLVPSRSLRDHLAAEVVRRRRKPVVGLIVQTLYGCALEILDRGSISSPTIPELFEVLSCRFAREDETFDKELRRFVDGHRFLVGSIGDFMDAGFEAIHADIVEEQLEALELPGVSAHDIKRARALVRMAERAWHAVEALGIGVPSHLLRLAGRCVEEDPTGSLPARAVLIHGFADATGAATDLIEGLVKRLGARVYLDHPPDPARPEVADPGIAFTGRFVGRLEAAASVHHPEDPAALPCRLSLFRAPGAQAEVRALAGRIGTLLERGAIPERIGVVGRDLRPYVIPVRLHFDRLGVPFSGSGTLGPQGPFGRRVQALRDLMRRRDESPFDRWLDAQEDPRCREAQRPKGLMSDWRDTPRYDLRLALRALGVSRLRDLRNVALDRLLPDGDDFALPVRRGFRAIEDDDGQNAARWAGRRKVPRACLIEMFEDAQALTARWDGWPPSAPLGVHLEALFAVLDHDLGWRRDRPAVDAVCRRLAALPKELAVELDLSYDEFVHLLELVLLRTGVLSMGGRGGGVQVLNVMEARGRTFEHLFVIGLNRDLFPRVIREDPFLPDDLRRAIRTVLPDMPVKRSGYDEEHYLFAQLISSSPSVTLSWQYVDDDGRPQTVSPLLERLRLYYRDLETETVPHLYDIQAATVDDREGRGADCPAYEQAVVVGLYGGRSHLSRILPLALEESLPQAGGDAAMLARVRMAVVDEIDPDQTVEKGRRRRRLPGPFYGFVGPPVDRRDPRGKEIFITTVEAMAACPWQTFVQRVLRLEPGPDPMEALPTVDAGLVGAAVHAVLEQLAHPALPERPARLEDVLDTEPISLDWPDATSLTRVLKETAERLVRESGSGPLELANVLEVLAMPFLEAAGRADWPHDEPLQLCGVELLGNLEITDDRGRPRTIFFRADRVDLHRGRLRLTDYKTGRSISEAQRAKTRRRSFLKGVGQGRWLQPVAYVLGARGRNAEGRNLYLKPDLPEEQRAFVVTAADRDFVTAFEEAVRAVLSAWDNGLFFPRLIEPDGRKEPGRCRYCSVSEACLRWDTGARARLIQWMERTEGARLEDHRAKSLRRLWALAGEDVREEAL
jgi:RecB family exonuclease